MVVIGVSHGGRQEEQRGWALEYERARGRSEGVGGGLAK